MIGPEKLDAISLSIVFSFFSVSGLPPFLLSSSLFPSPFPFPSPPPYLWLGQKLWTIRFSLLFLAAWRGAAAMAAAARDE